MIIDNLVEKIKSEKVYIFGAGEKGEIQHRTSKKHSI